MPSASQINGVPVICLADGSRLGKVKQIVVDSKRAAVVAFGVEGPHWWRPCRVVQIADVAGLSDEVLVVATAQTLRIVEEQPQLEQLLLAESDLAGRPVLASTGKFMGRVKDFVFEYPSGTISTIVVQPNGDPTVTQQVGADRISVLGLDAVIVHDRAAAVPALETLPTVAPSDPTPVAATSAAQPLATPSTPAVEPPAVPAAQEPAQPVAPVLSLPSASATAPAPALTVSPARALTVAAEPPTVVQTAAPAPAAVAPPPAGAQTTGADLARLFRERQERFLLGKTAQRAVRDDQGAVLVDADGVVDQETLDRVKAAGKLLELTASVSMRK